MELLAEEIAIKKYDAYKDSGVEWLGEIPDHWEVVKGKWLFIKKERPVRPHDEIVTCFRNGEVTLRANRKTEGFTNALKEYGYQGIRKGDLVIHAMDAFAGAIGISDSDGKGTPVYSVCTPRKNGTVNAHYYAFFLRNLAKSGFIQSLAKGIRERSTDFRFSDFGNLLLPVPHIEEQNMIVHFLNSKLSQIDKAIAQKERLIELLEEKKQISIRHALTSGLGGRSKASESSVGWIGKIPSGWRVRKMSHILSLLVDGTHFSPKSSSDGQYKYVTAKNIKENGFDFSEISFINERQHRVIYNRCPVQKGDVLYIKDGATAGIALVNTLDEEFSLLSSVALLRVRPNVVNAKYLKIFLNSSIIKGYIATQIVGGAMTRLTLELIRDFKVIVPSMEVQNAIVSRIERLEREIMTAIRFKYDEIAKLKEYKVTLINAAVTGKIKVC